MGALLSCSSIVGTIHIAYMSEVLRGGTLESINASHMSMGFRCVLRFLSTFPIRVEVRVRVDTGGAGGRNLSVLCCEEPLRHVVITVDHCVRDGDAWTCIWGLGLGVRG